MEYKAGLGSGQKMPRPVARHGAAMLGMSYRNAWAHLRHMEQRLGMKPVERRVGGSHGGGSRLTPDGDRLLRTYRAFRKTLDRGMPALWQTASRCPSR